MYFALYQESTQINGTAGNRNDFCLSVSLCFSLSASLNLLSRAVVDRSSFLMSVIRVIPPNGVGPSVPQDHRSVNGTREASSFDESRHQGVADSADGGTRDDARLQVMGEVLETHVSELKRLVP